MFKSYEILDIAIKLEENAEALYRSKAHDSGDPVLGEWLIRMADDEHKHAQWFDSLKKQVEIPEEDALIREMSQEMLTDFMGKSSLSLDDAVFSEISTLKDLVSTFIEFEKDTILFYELLQAFITDDETLKQLKMIIEEEKTHIEKFEGYLHG